MENRNIISEELRDISAGLANINRGNVYSVSPAYFNTLSEKILSRINSNEERDYAFNSVTPYTIRRGYFENLASDILGKIKTSSVGQLNEVHEELNEVAPLLNTINKASLYTVPEGYFDNLKASTIAEKPQAKIFSLSKKMRSYAAAAVVTGILAIGSYFIIDKDLSPTKSQAVNVKTAIKGLEDEEIINFLNTPATDNVTSSFSKKITPVHEVKQKLKEMTDEELQQYLRENEEPDEIEVDI